ncbi:7 transmembrane receptor (Secretin family) [Popillia japonica]|uniref:7 transmembrane receptor (Secretin family) n=1 Tax=Popillia japonica TaxID=7064 RepID=A0AAW1KF57_POPJA
MDLDVPIDVLTKKLGEDINLYSSSNQDDAYQKLLEEVKVLMNQRDTQFPGNDTELRLNEDECISRYLNESLTFVQKHPEGFCGTVFDSITCWPPTSINTTVVISCFSEFGGVRYDTSYNVSKRCMDNGNWSTSAYTCPAIVEHSSSEKILTTTTIYFTGYILSLLALSIAIAIFAYFKDLRCLRNRIHTNLMCAYMCVYFMWIITLSVQLNFKGDRPCIVLMILLHYFHLTTFFWMFVEGLYLYILVVKTLTRENFKLRVYACIGWGVPSLIIAVWAIVKSFMSLDASDDTSSAILFRHCPWLKAHLVDWIHQVPVIIVLLLNLFFLASIMWVLITKLRSANTVETQQYRKAAKALLVLMPLLGVTYMLMITTPPGEAYIMTMFYYGRAVLLSTQSTVIVFGRKNDRGRVLDNLNIHVKFGRKNDRGRVLDNLNIHVNPSKSTVIVFGRKNDRGRVLDNLNIHVNNHRSIPVDSIKNLGLTIDWSLVISDTTVLP